MTKQIALSDEAYKKLDLMRATTGKTFCELVMLGCEHNQVVEAFYHAIEVAETLARAHKENPNEVLIGLARAKSAFVDTPDKGAK